MIMSVDRCLSVVMPLKARRLLTYRPMAVFIFLSFFIPFAFNLTCFLAFTVEWRVDPSTNRSVAYMADTAWFPVDGTFAPRICYFFTLITKPVFLVIVSVTCVITISYLRQASLQRSQMTGSVKEKGDTEDNKVTKMLLFLCVVYAVILLLEMCSVMVATIVPEYDVYKKYHNTYVIIYQMLINPAIDKRNTIIIQSGADQSSKKVEKSLRPARQRVFTRCDSDTVSTSSATPRGRHVSYSDRRWPLGTEQVIDVCGGSSLHIQMVLKTHSHFTPTQALHVFNSRELRELRILTVEKLNTERAVILI
ncbi:uncharacterized protein LOC143290319 [Babylonia areolata]|uniref:uncharacterized protein LOC143290319 n=1 Tax=Babylonia areolata TaxID=304850 RepID=UPI003FD518B9